jgi:hypothetical protein
LPVASFAFLFLRNLRNLWINPFSAASGPDVRHKTVNYFRQTATSTDPQV